MSQPSAFLNSLPAKPLGISDGHVLLLWALSEPNLPYNGSQIIIPENLAIKLSEGNVDKLKQFLSRHFDNAPTMACADPENKVYRIFLTPASILPGSASHSSAGSPGTDLAARSPSENSEHFDDGDGIRIRVPGKKSKVPRPPNAFILYRKAHHSSLMADRPGLHNNEVSVILGRKWKNEPEDVKAKFKAIAEKMKADHAAQYPGYQYAPRKPGEKKRRLTAKKAAKLRAQADAEVEAEENSGSINNDVEQQDSNTHPQNAYSMRFDAATLAGVDNTNYPSFITPSGVNNSSITMPTGHQAVEQDYDATLLSNALSGGPADLFNHRNVSTGLSYANASDVAFMNSLVDWQGLEVDIVTVKMAEPALDGSSHFDNIEFGDAAIPMGDEAVIDQFDGVRDNTLLFN